MRVSREDQIFAPLPMGSKPVGSRRRSIGEARPCDPGASPCPEFMAPLQHRRAFRLDRLCRPAHNARANNGMEKRPCSIANGTRRSRSELTIANAFAPIVTILTTPLRLRLCKCSFESPCCCLSRSASDWGPIIWSECRPIDLSDGVRARRLAGKADVQTRGAATVKLPWDVSLKSRRSS